jgi:hypothetical protein
MAYIMAAIMTRQEFDHHLHVLGLTQAEAAHLLSTGARTVRRWAEDPSKMPGAAEQALRAWVRLHQRGLAWRPDGTVLASGDEEAIARHRQHAIDLDALLERVRARGGPAAPWRVDLERCFATLGPIKVHFYRLRNGGFAPQTYSRADAAPDPQRDWQLIEDAFACIAEALARSPDHGVETIGLGPPNLQDGRLICWDMNISPPVVTAIRCDDLRTTLERECPDTDCRRLLLDAVNRAEIGRITQSRLAAGEFEVRDFGIRLVNLSVEELRSASLRVDALHPAFAVRWGT